MLDRITGMQVFARAAAAGSFSAAARLLGLSQTMVTKHIVALEARLGTRLFHRSTRRLTLTESGRSFLESCESLLPAFEEAERAASAGQVEPSGVLRFSAPLSFGAMHLAGMLAGFSARYPQVKIDLGLSDRLVDIVEEGFDLTLRIGRLADSALVGRRIAESRVLVCAAPSYLARHGTPACVADLAAHCCLGYTLASSTAGGTGSGRWVFGPKGEVSVMTTGSLRANNGEALREAAIAGQGIIYQPSFLLADALRDGRLKILALDHPPVPPIGIFLLHAPTPFVPAKVRAMVAFLTEQCRGSPTWETGFSYPE